MAKSGERLRKIITQTAHAGMRMGLASMRDELKTLEDCLRMGLVPKNRLAKHLEEIEYTKKRIEKEIERVSNITATINENKDKRESLQNARYIKRMPSYDHIIDEYEPECHTSHREIDSDDNDDEEHEEEEAGDEVDFCSDKSWKRLCEFSAVGQYE